MLERFGNRSKTHVVGEGVKCSDDEFMGLSCMNTQDAKLLSCVLLPCRVFNSCWT
jgi:hypothetical protein